MDTTDTIGEHHDSHHIYSKKFVSFFCSCESLIFRQEWEHLSLHRLARRKSQFIAQDCSREKLATRLLTWTMTQCLHQSIKLEATPGVTTCVSKILQESTKRRHGHQGPGNWKQLDHQAPDDWLLQSILQMKRKFVVIQTLMERNTSASSTILQRISSRRTRRSTN